MNTTSFLTGNLAVARGAFEAQVAFASGFIGHPVTDILEAMRDEHGINVQFTPNEKVALEVAYGASRGGMRSLVALKHTGINIAAEPLVAAAYGGVHGALVVVAVDDPGMLSSMNEQDTRHFARSAKLPLLAPSDQQEAIEFIKLAADISETYTLPVIVRLTTRLAYSGSVVRISDQAEFKRKDVGDARSFPAAHRHEEIEKHLAALEGFGNKAFDINTIDVGSTEVGIITSGISYAYAKEVLPEASFLKLGIIHPLPHKLISYFASLVKRLYVIEELDPFLEEQIRAAGIEVIGKSAFPRTGELSPDIVAKGLEGEGVEARSIHANGFELPVRHSSTCEECAHHGLMRVFNRMALTIAGDMGCYSPGDLPPSAEDNDDACFCIGASMSVAYGMSIARNGSADTNTVTVLSGSTFMHSGLQALSNIAANKGTATVVILATPGHGSNLHAEVDFRKICEGLGIESIHTVSSNDEPRIAELLKQELPMKGVSVLIADTRI